MFRRTSFVWNGESVGGEPSAEKSAEEWEREKLANRVIGCAAAMKRVGLKECNYDQSKRFGFPAPVARFFTTPGDPKNGLPWWSARQIDSWLDEFKAFDRLMK